MPRATSKKELLSDIATNREKLITLLASLSPPDKTAADIVGTWSVKDVLAHLTAWEQMALGWYKAGENGEPVQMPTPDYKWNQTPQLNQKIYETHRDDSLDDVLARFEQSFDEIHGLIEQLSDEQMFTRAYYPWTNKNTFGTYLVSATSSHYLWAWKEIRKGLKQKAKAVAA